VFLIHDQSFFAIVLSFIVCVLSLITKLLMARRTSLEHNAWRIVINHVFVFYLCSVLSITLLPIYDFIREEVPQSINLIPFNLFRNFSHTVQHGDFNVTLRLFLLNISGNILLFVPLSLLAAMLYSGFRKFKWSMLLAFLLSLGIELLQYIETVNQIVSYRASDIDDIILNMTGSLIGFFLFKLLYKSANFKKFFDVVENSTGKGSGYTKQTW